ncbi:MAG: portal protein, partial [Candidatus Nanopelagicaceae bacterium]
FTKFIGRLRKRFSELFHDVLKTQLILKGIISPEDWDDMKEHIQYDYLFDNHFNELKEIEMMNQRMMSVTQMDPFVGKYFSVEYVRRHILGQKDKEFIEMDKQMRKEIDAGLAIDPAQTNMMDTMQQQNTAFAPEIGEIQAQDSAEREAAAADDNVDREVKKAKAMPKPSASNK